MILIINNTAATIIDDGMPLSNPLTNLGKPNSQIGHILSGR